MTKPDFFFTVRNISLFFLVVLIFIWFSSHTVAIRNVAAFFTLLGMIVFTLFQGKELIKIVVLRNILILSILMLLTIWVAYHSVYLANYHESAIHTFYLQWIRALLYGLIGILLGVSLEVNNKPVYFLRHGVTLIVVTLGVFVSVHALNVLWHLYQDNFLFGYVSFPIQSIYSDLNRDDMSVAVNILLVFLYSELFSRFTLKKYYIRVPTSLLLLFVIFSVVGVLTLDSRFGAVGFVSLNLVFITMWLFLFGKRFVTKNIIWLLSFVLFLLSTIFFSIKFDPRWENVLSTIPVAWDTENNKGWLMNHPLPNEDSTYTRVSSIKEGIKGIIDNPMGYGYKKSAFKTMILNKYGDEPKLGSSHSGLIDFGLSVGVIGLALYLLWMVLVMRMGLRHFLQNKEVTGLMLFVFTGSYLFRNTVDNLMFDHFFHFSFFMIMLLITVITLQQNEKEKYND